MFERHSSFRKSREAVKRVGGRELMIRLAREIKDTGDKTVILGESTRAMSLYTLRLHWDLKKNPSISASFPASWWASKSLELTGLPSGEIEVDVGSGEGDYISLTATIARQKIFDREKYGPLKNVGKMSLEKQVRLAMELAQYGSDFRYGEGEESGREKLVRNKYSGWNSKRVKI